MTARAEGFWWVRLCTDRNVQRTEGWSGLKPSAWHVVRVREVISPPPTVYFRHPFFPQEDVSVDDPGWEWGPYLGKEPAPAMASAVADAHVYGTGWVAIEKTKDGVAMRSPHPVNIMETLVAEAERTEESKPR